MPCLAPHKSMAHHSFAGTQHAKSGLIHLIKLASRLSRYQLPRMTLTPVVALPPWNKILMRTGRGDWSHDAMTSKPRGLGDTPSYQWSHFKAQLHLKYGTQPHITTLQLEWFVGKRSSELRNSTAGLGTLQLSTSNTNCAKNPSPQTV